MTEDLGFDLAELTFPQWRDWLVRYNKFVGDRDVQYAVKLRKRDDRIEQLEAALRTVKEWHGYGLPNETLKVIDTALGEKKDG